MGILATVEPLLDDGALEKYLPMTMDAATYKDHLYQLPLYFETLLFMYNRRYMQDEEVPATTDALLAYMEKNTGRGRYGFVEQHSTAYYSAAWIHGFGGSIIDETGTPFPDAQAVKDALEYHLQFVALMPGETEYNTVNTLFLEGKADATIGGPWMVPSAREAQIDLGIAAMPTVDAAGTALAPYSGVQGIHVLNFAAQQKTEPVKKLLAALTDPAIGIDLALASGCAPANSLCYDDERVAGDELVQAMRTTAEIAVPMPNIPEMDVMWTVVGNLLTDINLSGKDIDESLDAALAQANQLIEAKKSTGVMPLKNRTKETLASYTWSSPSLLLIALMVVFPIAYTGYISLTNMNVYHWFDFNIIGLKNYFRALFVFDSGFLSALSATVLWTAVNMILQLVIAFVLATLLNIQKLRLRKLYKTLLMFPWAMPGYVSILLWKTGIFNTQFGLLNQWMEKLGAEAVRWLSNDISAFLCCTVVNLWLALPFMIMIMDGAMQSIDRSYYESALLDGATWLERTRYITLPAITPIIAPAVIITIFTTFKQFDVVYLLTQQAGAKTGSGFHTILTYAYENAFITNNYGYSSAISIIIFILLLIFSARYQLREEGDK